MVDGWIIRGMEYRVVCLVNAQDEEQLSNEEGRRSVVDDAAQV